MKMAKILLPLLVVLLGLGAAVTLIRSKSEVERSSPVSKPPLVRVMEVEMAELRLTVESQGTVQPRVESSLVAQVSGRIDWVSTDFAEGGFFTQGQELVRIEERDFRLAVAQAEAQVAQATVQLELEQAEAELASEEWGELVEGEPSDLALRRPQLAEAQARLQAAQASLEQAELDLERTRIRAPFAGRVRSTEVDLGQFLSRGIVLARIYSTDAVEIRLPVTKEQIAFLNLGPQLVLRSGDEAGPSVSIRGRIGDKTYDWPGYIVRTGSEFDPRTRMLPLFARVDDPYGKAREVAGAPLPVGLFVEAVIEGRLLENAVTVPREALRADNQLLIVDAESRLRFRDVKPFRIERDSAVLVGGLEDGDRVCISQLDTVIDGMEVRTIDSSDGSNADREEA